MIWTVIKIYMCDNFNSTNGGREDGGELDKDTVRKNQQEVGWIMDN